MKIVLDNSVVIAWCMADEINATAQAAMQAATEYGGVVPALWWYEIRNVLIVNERRGRLTPADTHATLNDLRNLGLEIDHDHDEGVVLELARRHELSVYDSAYLEVAQRRDLSLASLDSKLCRAAQAAGIALCTAS